MALVNQVSLFCATQTCLLPFRDLLKKDTPFYWDETLDQLFNETKAHIAKEVGKGIMSFNLTRAPLGYSAERAPLGAGGQILPPPLPNSRTNRRSEAGEGAIESSEREDSNAH